MNKCTDILNDSIWKHAIEIPLYIFVPFKTRVLERSVISLQLIQQFSFQRFFFTQLPLLYTTCLLLIV